jgi:hypothetical protein
VPHDGKEVTMPSRRETITRDRRKNCASRKKTHKEQEQRQQQLSATLRRLEAAEKNARASA